MKKAKIVKIVFEEGEYGLTQGHKAFEKPHYRRKTGMQMLLTF